MLRRCQSSTVLGKDAAEHLIQRRDEADLAGIWRRQDPLLHIAIFSVNFQIAPQSVNFTILMEAVTKSWRDEGCRLAGGTRRCGAPNERESDVG